MVFSSSTAADLPAGQVVDWTSQAEVMTEQELLRLDAWWRAANYLAVGMIYLRANPLLREPLLQMLVPRCSMDVLSERHGRMEACLLPE